MKDTFKKFLEALLNDDNGISEEAFNLLVEIQDETRDGAILLAIAEIRPLVDATDGRFYIRAD